MKRYLNKKNGFTLVELLIVIALIAILSVAVLATINPIEQTNKARDARVQNDAAEVMNAAERYYASVSRYPWEAFADLLTSADPVLLKSDTFGFGICNGSPAAAKTHNAVAPVTSCSADDDLPNVLIETSELKSSFAGKDEFPLLGGGGTNGHPELAMWLAKEANSNTFYVCYVPKANANKTDVSKMRCLTAAGVVSKAEADGGAGVCATGNVAVWTSPVTDGLQAMFRCVPE